MKENEFSDAVSNIDSDVVERFISMDNQLQSKVDRTANQKKTKGIWLRLGAVAACFALIISAIIVVPMLREDDPGIIPYPDNRPGKPTVNVQTSSAAPQYYGSEDSNRMPGSVQAEINPTGLSVTAKLVEALPDTYTFFDDWNQYEFRLLRMKTVKLLNGQKMTVEFYYLIPVDFMTDFSVFDSFVIKDMAQFAYEYSVMYNKTQKKAEQLNLVLFGYRVYGFTVMGENFMAFDADGVSDKRLWNANESWIAATESAKGVDTITKAEEKIRNNGREKNKLYVHLLKDISGEAANVLSQVKSFDNGIYVQTFSSGMLQFSPEVQFHAVRYINGFATNEKVNVWSKEWEGGEKDTYSFTKAHFDDSDLNALPDLASAISSIASAYDKGEIVPPHITNHEELNLVTYGIFGWYAKTNDGVIGVVRVTWQYFEGKSDDAYYIVEYGSDECQSIDRDALIQKIGEYETTYIYDGAYNETEKDLSEIKCLYELQPKIQLP